jgi:predicted PurR-regulated permease PerM
LFSPARRFTGTSYAAAVALVIVALIFSPAVLFMSGRRISGSISVAFVFSAICFGLAWFSWTRSQLTVAALNEAPPRSK